MKKLQTILFDQDGVLADYTKALLRAVAREFPQLPMPRIEDVTSWMHTVGSNSFRYLEAFLMAGGIYLVLAQTINLLRIGTGRWLLSHSPAATRQ